MTFQYPELTTVNHNNQRWYDTPKGFYPSITTILGFTEAPEKKASLENWRNSLGHEKANAVSNRALSHGTNVHLLAERFLKGEDPLAPIGGQPVPQLDIDAFNALKLKLGKVTKVYGQEVALYSEALEVAGRCDLIGEYKNLPVIIDFKTASRVKHHKDIGDYKLQLCFYGMAHNQMFDTNIEDGLILMVSETGFPQEFKVKLFDHLEELAERVEVFWDAALANA